MTRCDRYAGRDSAERYVAGRMTAQDAAAFEQHFLACDKCLDAVRGIEDVRDALVERRAAIARGDADPLTAPGLAGTRSWSRKSQAWTGATWLAAAAALIAAIGWMLGGLARSGPATPAGDLVTTVARDTPSASAPSQTPPFSAVTPGQPAPSGQAGQPALPAGSQAGSNQAPPANASSQPPPGAPGAASGTSPAAGSGPTALIARLAIVMPPPYVAVPVRGEGDNAQKVFAAAMTRYRAGDFAGASTGLRGLVEKSPDLVSAQFYLGICELMMRQPRRAETALRAAADSEVTPYADEAYFYLAKAALQRGDLTAAERALTEADAREAGPGNEARRLLEEVRALGRS